MACRQDPELEQLGIAVDVFTSQARIICLSHAHSDHTSGLASHFGKKLGYAKIYCTRVTAELVQHTVKGLKANDFHVLPYHRPIQLSSSVTVTAFPSFHCDGASMFYFQTKKSKILYSGDFRFREEMRQFGLGDLVVDRFYWDDTFDEIRQEYPTYEVTLDAMLAFITEQPLAQPIYIHCGILGLEPILREMSSILDEQFRVTETLQNTWRGKQLEYLLAGKLNPKARLVLGNWKKDAHDGHWWLIPTCTYFLCPTPPPNQQQHHRIFFCTHSNHVENNQMKQLITAHETIACGTAVNPHEFTCR